MQHPPPTAEQRAFVRRGMAVTGAMCGLAADSAVFATSVGRLPLSRSFLQVEALALVLVGPALGALLGMTVARMHLLATVVLSLVLCLVAPFVVGGVVALILPATDSSIDADTVMHYATIGAQGYSRALGVLGVIFAFVLSRRRATLSSALIPGA